MNRRRFVTCRMPLFSILTLCKADDDKKRYKSFGMMSKNKNMHKVFLQLGDYQIAV